MLFRPLWYGDGEDAIRVQELFEKTLDPEGKRGGAKGIALFRELLKNTKFDRPEQLDLGELLTLLRSNTLSRLAASLPPTDPFPPPDGLHAILNLITAQPDGI